MLLDSSLVTPRLILKDPCLWTSWELAEFAQWKNSRELLYFTQHTQASRLPLEAQYVHSKGSSYRTYVRT